MNFAVHQRSKLFCFLEHFSQFDILFLQQARTVGTWRLQNVGERKAVGMCKLECWQRNILFGQISFLI